MLFCSVLDYPAVDVSKDLQDPLCDYGYSRKAGSAELITFR